jgi:hypothetical protein
MRVLQAISAVALVAATVLALGAGAVAAAPAATDTPSLLLAGAVKAAMKAKMPKLVKGLVMTKVTCTVPKTSTKIAGTCQARFTVARVNLKGVYGVKASMTGAGKLAWSTTTLKCTDAKSNKTMAC